MGPPCHPAWRRRPSDTRPTSEFLTLEGPLCLDRCSRATAGCSKASLKRIDSPALSVGRCLSVFIRIQELCRTATCNQSGDVCARPSGSCCEHGSITACSSCHVQVLHMYRESTLAKIVSEWESKPSYASAQPFPDKKLNARNKHRCRYRPAKHL